MLLDLNPGRRSVEISRLLLGRSTFRINVYLCLNGHLRLIGHMRRERSEGEIQRNEAPLEKATIEKGVGRNVARASRHGSSSRVFLVGD